MALITTYTTLQTAMDGWLDHTLYSAKYPEMIQLFEAAANRKLRVRQQETAITLTTSSGQSTLPTDYLSWRDALWLGTPHVDLEYVEISYLYAAFPTSEAGTPRIFSITGTQFLARPVNDDSGVLLTYNQKIPALADNSTNWLLTAHPDLYLFGSLVEAEMFGVNDERASGWLARRDAIFDEIEKLSNKTRGAGAIRVMGATP